MFQLCPDTGPPRLIRFVASADMPAPDVIATLDPRQNLLRIDREVFDLLDRLDQEMVLRTSARHLELASVKLG